MLVIAHRGANREAVENSCTAFDLAIAGGAQRLELDVHLSRDGHAVIMHDDRFGATVEAKAKGLVISQLDRGDIERLCLKNGEPIPFLDQVIDRYLGRVELNIEIKGPSTALAAAVAAQVARHPRREAVIVSCFHAPPLVWLRQHAPAIRRACLWSSDTFSWPYFAILAPTVFLDQAGTNILHPRADLVDENLMDQANARGWLVYAWVPMAGEERDREGLWSAMKTLGLHGLCTNYPRQLHSWLEEAAIDEQHWNQHRP